MSPELERLARRAALPITVSFDNYFSRYRIGAPGRDRFLFNVREAKSAYLRLVTETESGASSPRSPDTAAADPASSRPGDAL